MLLGILADMVCASDANQKSSCKKVVSIQRGDTLAGICRRHLKKYNRSVLQKVLRLNPNIANPNLIVVGARLCLPELKSPPKKSIQTKSQIPDAAETFATRPKPSVQRKRKSGGSQKAVLYPSPMPGAITRLKWTGDNTAIVEGKADTTGSCRFFVYVPGDLEYEQPNLMRNPDGTFQVEATIGRQARDYGTTFVLKLAIFNVMDERIGEVRASVIRERHENGDVVWLEKLDGTGNVSSKLRGWAGARAWVAIQERDAMQTDNADFRVPNGRIVANYRYLGYNPDERYLTWYGRITLYGSACLAKALLLRGNITKAEEILRVWAAQVDSAGKVPRSANVIGDNYISPNVRTGEIAHFLGALAAAKKVTGSAEWDGPINKIVNLYLRPLTDSDSGLIRGGYNGKGSTGYGKPNGYEMIPWCSAEHNFDVFQALVLLAHVYKGADLGTTCQNMASRIANSVDQYLWDDQAGTFNRGWNKDTGPDRARALDCASWGALFLLKRARLTENETDAAAFLKKARRCLDYADKNFRTRWYYQTLNGERGSVRGYRPYDGSIDDLRHEEGKNAGKMIHWKSLNDMVWSEGTLGVAKVWEEFARQTDDQNARQRFREIYKQMLKLQALSDKGGVLYSTRQIKGQFTMGEELASLGWLAYLASVSDGVAESNQNDLIRWMPW